MRAKDALAGKLFELFGPKGWDRGCIQQLVCETTLGGIRLEEDIVGTIGFEPIPTQYFMVLAGLRWQPEYRKGSQRNNYWTRIGHCEEVRVLSEGSLGRFRQSLAKFAHARNKNLTVAVFFPHRAHHTESCVPQA